MISLLWRCIHCDSPLSLVELPLCGECRAALIPCPALCPICAGPECPQAPGASCQRPWLGSGELQGYHSGYLLVGQAHAILRTWKKHRGPLFDRLILNPDLWKSAALHRLAHLDIRWIVPIPQRHSRQWQLGGSRSELLARWLSRQMGIPWVAALRKTRSPMSAHQGRLSVAGRLENRLEFAWRSAQVKDRLSDGGILLVDDIMTSGHTLRLAASALQLGRSERSIFSFSLGVRPKLYAKPANHLLKGASGAIGIRNKDQAANFR